MIDLFDVLKRRDAGYGRIAFVRDHVAGLPDSVLVRFGLRPLRTMLKVCDRAAAVCILSRLLARDMAYGDELMSKAEADDLAEAFTAAFARAGAIFHTNEEAFAPDVVTHAEMTDATFDAGIIVENPDHTYACIWFEDED